MKIYVDFERPKTVKEFLTLLFVIDHNGWIKAKTTYRDKECIEIQCRAPKFRSFDELFNIIKTYYPSYTPYKLIITLLKFKINKLNHNNINTTYYIRFIECSNINKITIACSPYIQEYIFISVINNKNSSINVRELFIKLGEINYNKLINQ